MTARIPRRIVVNRETERLIVDDEEFPYLIHADGPSVRSERDEGWSVVTVDIFCESVEVIGAGNGEIKPPRS